MSRLSEAAFQLAYFFLRLGVPAILHSDDGSLVDYWAEGCVASSPRQPCRVLLSEPVGRI